MPEFLAIQNLTHRYGERTALADLTFSVAAGEVFGLLGPNGSGKTTLFRILSTLLPATPGSVTIEGRDLAREQAAVRQKLGIVFQAPSLDKKLTVAENLRHQGHLYGLEGAPLRERIAEVLGRFSLSDRADEIVEKLSGGLQRRVEVAKGLLHRPRLLLLDEPTTGLDPAARLELWSYLLQLNREEGTTILVTTHIMDEAERCGRLLILNHGQRVALDSPAGLKAPGGSVMTFVARDPEALREALSGESSFRATVLGNTVRLDAQGGTAVVTLPAAQAKAAEILARHGDHIEAVTIAQPTLEDVFLRLTGSRFYDSASGTGQTSGD